MQTHLGSPTPTKTGGGITMTNVNKVNSSEKLTEQIAELEFYRNQLLGILELCSDHPPQYVAKTRELLIRVDGSLTQAYMELGATILRDELIGEVTQDFSPEQKEKMV
jgi:hypothetical protein